MTRLLLIFLKCFLGIAVFSAAFFWRHEPPAYLLSHDAAVSVPAKSVRFYADTTWVDSSDTRKTEAHIWDRVFALIDNADQFIVLDFFLFNSFQGIPKEETRALAPMLTEHLVAKKQANKNTEITLITDPINEVYGGDISPHLQSLRDVGVGVVTTNLTPLRDSNLAWSAFWRSYGVWWKNTPEGGWLPHPFASDGKKVTMRSWAALLNFKANHRKLILADEVQERRGATTTARKMVTLITSSNPHDGSSAHGNVALEVRDGLWKSVLDSERAIMKLSGAPVSTYAPSDVRDETGALSVTLLRERAIKEKVLDILARSVRGDKLSLAMFYLSDRDIIPALILAANRGVEIRIILDPNKDAFGFEKNGIPNRPVAKELLNASGGDIAVRWCDTHGEQCHAKLFMGQMATSSFLLLGSANFTRRNLDNFNLEASVIVESASTFPAYLAADAYFDKLWTNDGGGFTTDYETYKDATMWKTSLYRMMERTGISTF